jgi:hypothetical protein
LALKTGRTKYPRRVNAEAMALASFSGEFSIPTFSYFRLSSVELPRWNELVSFAGLVVGAPQNIFECALICRELAIRCATTPNAQFDKALTARFKSNSRIRQFSLSLSDTLVAAGGLPSDMGKRVQDIFSSI